MPEVARAAEFIHFACTSEDINNLAHGLALASARSEILLPSLRAIAADLRGLAHAHAGVPMLARTHGQAAEQTTLGKEFANVYARLERQIAAIKRVPLKDEDQRGGRQLQRARRRVSGRRLGARCRASRRRTRTRVQPLHHADRAARLHGRAVSMRVARANTILIDLDRAMSGATCRSGYFRQRLRAGEVGSS